MWICTLATRPGSSGTKVPLIPTVVLLSVIWGGDGDEMKVKMKGNEGKG